MQLGKNRLFRLLAVLFAATLVLGACGGDDDNESAGDNTTDEGTGAEGEGVECDGLAIGFFGALTGPNANLGKNMFNGAKVAIEEFSEENPNCEVELKEFDSAGSADQAPALAQQAVGDKSLVGLIGPAFSGESRTANPILDQGGLTIITPSATGVDLSTKGWKTFHRAVGNDNSQGPAIVKYLKNELNVKAVAVLDDKSEYGKGIADIVRKDFGDAVKVNDSFDDKATEFSSTVNKVKAANVDAVVFGGYYSQAGPLAKQLKDGGVNATFVGPDGVLDQGFIDAAGTAAEGAILTAPSAPSDAVDGADEFADKYQEINKAEVGLYSLEAYDAAKIYLQCISEGATTRADVEKCVDEIEYKGLTKTYKFAANGELDGEVTIYAYRVKGGKIEGVGPIGG
ncbi:MAG TPA: branched-chain amino acid ABC transporter substrate-binding protein [Acidimicrobiales bacterium]|jgi:branched-chain amino acid transport system substrate-binding protein|nr:branched-chain amino acid ABC transporter substrate-binding protein [Acidimicrobiales bacterium]